MKSTFLMKSEGNKRPKRKLGGSAIARREGEEDDNDVIGKEIREARKEGITKQYTKPTGNITR
jgi:hypothetical protein